MAFKSALMILAALTLATTAKATASTTTTTTTTTLAATTTTTTVATTTTTTVATTTGPTTTTTTGPTTTTTTGPTTTAGATTTAAPLATTVAPKPTTTTANITNTTTTGIASTTLTEPVLAGATTLAVADIDGFTKGMEIVIGLGTPNVEFNTITGFGTIHLATPVQNNHPAGTTVTQKKADETTTTTLAPNPCAPTTTTTIEVVPCVPEVITTTRGPCDPVVKYDAKVGAFAGGNTLSMMGWGFAGFVGVAVAMVAIRRNARRATSYSRLANGDLEHAMVESSEVAPQE